MTHSKRIIAEHRAKKEALYHATARIMTLWSVFVSVWLPVLLKGLNA